MTVIRPFNPPVVTPQPTLRARDSVEARAAQRAFFQQALGDVTPVRAAPATAPTAQVSAPLPARSTGGVVRPIPEEPPAHPMRPGSFVDLKV